MVVSRAVGRRSLRIKSRVQPTACSMKCSTVAINWYRRVLFPPVLRLIRSTKLVLCGGVSLKSRLFKPLSRPFIALFMYY